MTVTITYDAALSRMQITGDVDAASVKGKIERSLNGVQWTTVRGGSDLAPVSNTVSVDDYEFVPGVVNTYRVRGLSAVDVVLSTETDTVTPSIDRVWLKSIARPFLNREVVVIDYTPPQRKSRAGVFEVSGRTLPVVVSQEASSRSWTMQTLSGDEAEAHALDLLLASGDVIYVQVPAGFDIPGGYVAVGDTELARISRPLRDPRRRHTIPLRECAAPGPDVVGFTTTWAGLLAEFGSWTAVLAQFPTWADVLEFVADPETVLVP